MSLNLKLSVALVIALLLTLTMYGAISWVEKSIAQKNYKSEEAQERNLDLAFDQLQRFVDKYDVAADATNTLQIWLKEHDYTYLYIYDNHKVAFEGGWWVESDKNQSSTDVVTTDKKNEKKTETTGERLTKDEYHEDANNRIVNFSNGEYYVYIDVYKEQHLYSIMAIIKVIFCVGTLLGTLLLYNGRIIKRMIKMSAVVKKISDGDMAAEIQPAANDEIGRLAVSIGVMRDSIVEKLRNEKEAWDANTQLITAMSHDIRTPLTSMIGYLDIIEGKKYLSEEERDKYIASCRDKAFQLKDLSDKLFQYFLVFGSHDGEKKLEVFDGGILLQQLISEHTAELINYGFKIDFEYTIGDVNIKVDISGIRRLFDNVFSNILKYGDKNEIVKISAVVDGEDIAVKLKNTVLESSRKVESNKIGLKTCEKISLDMGGRFIYKDEGSMFTILIRIPVCDEEVEPEESEETEGVKE